VRGISYQAPPGVSLHPGDRRRRGDVADDAACGTDGLQTPRRRGVDSNFRLRDALSPPTARPWWPGWLDNKRQLVDLPPDISIAEAGNCSDDTVAPTVDRRKPRSRCLLARNRKFESTPSSRESVSRPKPLSKVQNPGFPRGCARLARRLGRQRRARCSDIAPTGGNISVGPYSSTAVALTGSVGMPRWSQRSESLSGFDRALDL
jgi:hypothetical protein